MAGPVSGGEPGRRRACHRPGSRLRAHPEQRRRLRLDPASGREPSEGSPGRRQNLRSQGLLGWRRCSGLSSRTPPSRARAGAGPSVGTGRRGDLQSTRVTGPATRSIGVARSGSSPRSRAGSASGPPPARPTSLREQRGRARGPQLGWRPTLLRGHAADDPGISRGDGPPRRGNRVLAAVPARWSLDNELPGAGPLDLPEPPAFAAGGGDRTSEHMKRGEPARVFRIGKPARDSRAGEPPRESAEGGPAI